MKMARTNMFILSPIVRIMIFFLAIAIEVIIAVVKAQGIAPPMFLEVFGHCVNAIMVTLSVFPEMRTVRTGCTRQLARRLSATPLRPDPDIELARSLSAPSQLSQPGLPNIDADSGARPGESLA